MGRKKCFIFVVVTNAILICLQAVFWISKDVIQNVTPIRNYELRRHKMANISISRCNNSSGNLIGYEQDNRDKTLIVYSEMPKCGSRTFIIILSHVCKYSKHYSTEYTWPTPSHNVLKSVESKRKFVSTKILPRRPYIFMGHLSFLDFVELGYKQPLYIDIVRDPVERWISLFYSKRASRFHIDRLKLTHKEINQTIEGCLQIWISLTGCSGRSVKATADCLKSKPYKGCREEQVISMYPIWFSGRYINSSQVSVKKAKTNIEKYYTLIGLTEYFDETLKAMETILPGFTNELSNTYKMVDNAQVGRNKVKPSNESFALLRELLSDDYKLYGFIRQRFHMHLNCLALNMTKH
ncbi:unnamed protein product [Owenia fusiformis]|uniref:Uncharacterized protein n=1 Tax=Owenia fusiformis TaxID=6347 RepID=A0A8J1XJ01_OWEFU|nr:unnamed protein product [Owenia fusiformis]